MAAETWCGAAQQPSPGRVRALRRQQAGHVPRAFTPNQPGLGVFFKRLPPGTSRCTNVKDSARRSAGIGSKAPLWHFLSLLPSPGAPALPLKGSKFASGFSRQGTAPLASPATEERVPRCSAGKPANTSRLHKASAKAGKTGHQRYHGLSARRCLERHLTLDGLGSTAGLC